MSALQWIGKAVPRIDGVAKVTATLVFPSDMRAPGMLHCRPVLAPHPHALLRAIHTADALAVPGVVRVLTAADVPGSNRYGYRSDHPVLCDDKTRHGGDMVAVVAAESEAAAQAGAAAVRIDFEPLPLVTDPEEALKPGSPLVHAGGNLLHQIHYADGDVAAIFGRPDVIDVERTYVLQRQDHAFLETEAGIAFPDGDGVRIVAGGQNVWYDQQQVARGLGLPADKVHMIEAYTGGAFGGKGDITVQIVVGVAALATGRPCRMVWTREEHFLAGVKRHPYKITARTACDRAGKLLALQAHIVSDTGAYAAFGDSILELTVENIAGLYRIPNVRLDAWAAYTNNPVAGAFRGFGAAQGCFAIEGQMSEMAAQLGMDEIEFRRRNLVQQGERTALGHILLLPVAVDQALAVAQAHPLWRERQRESAGPLRRGVGVALGMKGYTLGMGGMPDKAVADLELLPEGSYLLGLGIIDLGQGSFTALAQMAAEVLRCEPGLVQVCAADTRLNRESGTTAASRVTYAVGRAVLAAAEDLAQRIREAAAGALGVPASRLVLAGDSVREIDGPGSLGLAEVAGRAGQPLRVTAEKWVPLADHPASGALGHPHALYSSNVQLAQVAVDAETGDVRVERVVAFPEIGQVINRHGLEGQVEGGVAQGLGYALMEELMVKDGRILNPDFSTYPIPSSLDVPAVETIPVEAPEASGPFGAKGAGENATLPTAPAILDAICAATGVRFTSMPVTAERMLKALKP